MPDAPDAPDVPDVPEPARTLLPLADSPAPPRRDAVRNREALLAAAATLVEEHGAACVTTEQVAARASVGKATVFRRFGSREGLMAALLDRSEAAWQAEVLAGPPPVGPGAPAVDRLLAFGRSRLERNLAHADLIRAAGAEGHRPAAPASFAASHVRHLLAEVGTPGDLPLLAAALLAPLEVPVLVQQVRADGLPVDRVAAAWADLALRVAHGSPPGAG